MKTITMIYAMVFSIFSLFGCIVNDDDANGNGVNCDQELISDAECFAWIGDSSLQGFTVHSFTNSNVIESEGNYDSGIPSGFWKFYYPDGRIHMEGNYSNERKNGFWKSFNQAGFLEWEGNFTNCIRDGFWKFYYPNGQLKSEGNFTNAIKNGNWKFYFDNGVLDTELNYRCL